MRKNAFARAYGCAFTLLLVSSAAGTLIPRLSFEQLTDGSDLIVEGTITNTWAAWDPEHKYIWTHYNLSVHATVKGAADASVEFAEPGGALGDRVMSIAGSVAYAAGDHVVVFLSRMPNGYLRTAGWSQGRYAVDTAGRLHGSALPAAETTSAVRSLEGMSLPELRRQVAGRVRETQGKTR